VTKNFLDKQRELGDDGKTMFREWKLLLKKLRKEGLRERFVPLSELYSELSDGKNGVGGERYDTGVLMEKFPDLFRPERTGQGQTENDREETTGEAGGNGGQHFGEFWARVWLSGGVVLTLLCGGISQTVRRGFWSGERAH